MSPEELAKHVIRSYWDGILPVEPIRIAKALGIQVEIDNSMNENIATIVSYDDVALIRYSSTEPYLRQRYAIAHSIGHVMLKHTSKIDIAENYTMVIYKKEEREANTFALGLLMPKYDLDKKIESGITSLRELAKRFEVSEVAMHERLIQLKWLTRK